METSTQHCQLFTPLVLREVTSRNRIMVSPMCQYSAADGMVNDWHLVHLGSRAVGGAGIVMVEAAGVEPRGRISPQDVGIWNDAQAGALARIARFMEEQGAVAAIQLAHAGRKASTYRPWSGSGAVPAAEGGWQVIGPSATPFSPSYPMPRAMTHDDIQTVVRAFAAAAERSREAGFRIVEIHAAHGYLIHEFLSPLSNERDDEYGGSFRNRVRFGLEVIEAVRAAWPDELPLLLRISATDWTAGGWDIDESVEFARLAKQRGVDLVDVSTGGNVAAASIPVKPGYQVPFAERIRREADIPTAAVGLITDAQQAESILREGQADLIALAREELRDPYWPIHAAHELGLDPQYPPQYERARPPKARVR